MVTALLDACVLYPAPLRDLLIGLAGAGLYHGRWTEEIHREWIENLLENEPYRDRLKLERTRKLMDAAVIGCLITDYERLIPTLNLPDPGDLHVLAAAIQGQAEVIVTLKLRDFPENDLARYGLQAQSPDDFIADLIQTEAQAVFTAIRKLRSRLKNPPRSAQEYLGTLRQQPLPKTVAHLETVLDAI